MYVCMYVYDELLGRGRVPESSAIDLEAFNLFFLAEKVASVRLKYQRRAAGVVQPCATWRVLAVFRQHSISLSSRKPGQSPGRRLACAEVHQNFDALAGMGECLTPKATILPICVICDRVHIRIGQ